MDLYMDFYNLIQQRNQYVFGLDLNDKERIHHKFSNLKANEHNVQLFQCKNFF